MDDLDFSEIWNIIKKRKWFLIIFILTVLMGTTFYIFMAPRVYEAKARVLVNLEKPDPVNLTNNLPKEFKGKEFFETQVALIKSRSLIKNVITKLKLTENKEFQTNDSLLTELSTWFKSLVMNLGFNKNLPESIKPDPYGLLIDQIIDERLDVRQVNDSRVLEISFQGESPRLVAEITNALTHEYIAKTLEWYKAADGNTVGWMNNKLMDLNAKLKESENKLQEFKQKRSFIETKGGRDLVSKKWNEISQELTKAATARLRLETQIQELKALKDDPLKLLLSQPFLFNNNLSELQKNYIALNNELNSLLRSKTSQHPDVVLLVKRLGLLDRKIPSEVDNFLSSLTIKLKAAVNQEKSLERILERQRKIIMKTDNDFLQFRFLKQEVELNEKLYNEISNRKKELEVTSNFNSSNVSIVDPAETPYSPVKPKKGLSLILAFLSSSFVGLLLIFFRESQDKTLKMEEDFDDHHPYFYWGSIAKIPKKNLSSSLANPEEFRSLKTEFLLKTKDSSNKIFLVTSPTPEEGKSFITLNLAISLGISGKKVLVIDGDFYNSKISSMFDSQQKPGYLDNLSDFKHDGETYNSKISSIFDSQQESGYPDNLPDFNRIYHRTNFKNVWVTPSGNVTRENSKTSDVFFSDPFQHFLKGAEDRWDYILIKAPPILATPDAKVLENYCHGVLLVLQSGDHDPVGVGKVFNQFISEKPKQRIDDNGKPRSQKKLMGVVINKVDRKYKEIEYSYYRKLG